jgi:hypothetical protein
MPWYVSPVDVATATPGGGYAVWSVLSHALFFVFVARAAMLRDYFGGPVVLVLTIISMGYHWCQVRESPLHREAPRLRVMSRAGTRVAASN